MSNYKLFNMCMVYNKGNNQVLVQDKVEDDGWGGITFPGGHIEYGESFVESAIREVKEETEEGKVFWVNADELHTMDLAPNMDKYLKLFFSDIHHEAFAKCNSNHTDQLRII